MRDGVVSLHLYRYFYALYFVTTPDLTIIFETLEGFNSLFYINMEVVSVQKIISRRAFLLFFVTMFSIIIFFPGCGGRNFDGSGNSSDYNANQDQLATLRGSKTGPSSIDFTKCFGGGGYESVGSICRTSDGGYIVGGSTSSNNGNVSGNHGKHDVWVIKLDSGGTIQWQKCLGGSEGDYANSICQTSDGGYIVGGSTFSNNGNVSGSHEPILTECHDAWIVKLGSDGAIQWQKCLGGTGDDYASSICQASDGGYIIGGATYSNDGDVSGKHNHDYIYDAWVVKLNSGGTIQWQKCLGGSDEDFANSICQTSDSGYIIGGSTSSIDGDVQGKHNPDYIYDAWVVKLDSGGTIQWQKCLGGSEDDFANSICQTSDGGYIIGGSTYSNDGDVQGDNHGGQDCWVVRLDSGGTIRWQKCFGGSGYDLASSICLTDDGGYIIGGATYSNDGDVQGDNHGASDCWVVKRRGEKQFSIENVLVSPSVFKPYDEKTTIIADIVTTDFTPTNLNWEVSITDKNDKVIKHLSTGTSSSIVTEWDGLRDDGNYASGDADDVFKLDDQGHIIKPEYTSITYKGAYNIKISAVCSECSTSVSQTVNVDNRPMEIVPYNQQDSRWSDTILDHCSNLPTNTIGRIGCALTSSSMMIAYHNRLFGGLIVNPLNLNNALNDYNGFKRDSSGAIRWSRIPSCLKSIGLVVNVKFNGAHIYNSDIIDHEITNHCPPIVGILNPDPNKKSGSMHFVLVKGKMGKDKHIISDPGYKKYYEDIHSGSEYDGVKFEDLYLEDYLNNSTTDTNKITTLDWMVKFMPVNGLWPFKSLEISCIDETGSSVEYAIIDPQGRYLGYNPADGITVENKHVITGEIPDAQYFYTPFSSIDSDLTLGKAKYLWVRNPIAGTYKLKVFGINASEHYWLDIGSDHPDEDSVPIDGFVTPGQVIEYSITFSPTVGNIPVVSLNECINGNLELEPATLNLNSNGNYVTAHISLPTGYNIQDIGISSLRLENSIPALSHPTASCDNNKLMVKFDRQALVNYIKSKGITSGEVTLTVTGNVGGTSFKASDKIRVK